MKQDFSFGIIPLRQRKTQWQVLLIQHQAGHWAFPKGHAEEGESALQAAERELQEETGLVVSHYLFDKPLSESYVFFAHHHPIHKVVHYFLAQVKGTLSLQKSEIKSSQWLSLTEAVQVITFMESKKLCLNIQQILEKIE